MEQIQHIQLKFFAKDSAFDIEKAVPFFHAWIQESFTSDLLLDVVDYSHIQFGPGILLIGHEACYSIDTGLGQKTGFLYSRKTMLPGSAAQVLKASLKAALEAALIVESKLGLSLQADSMLLVLNDRLLTPNTAALFQSLSAFLSKELPWNLQAFEHHSEHPGQRLACRIAVKATSLQELLQAL